jgi:pyruvate formate lyase activating enzyme
MTAPATVPRTGEGSVADPTRRSPDSVGAAVGHGQEGMAERGNAAALGQPRQTTADQDHDRQSPAPVLLGAPAFHESDELRDFRLQAQHVGSMGSVHSWELVTAVDGPGTRLTIFLSGCALRCQYCQNPDTWQIRDGMPTTIQQIRRRIDRYAPVLRAAHGGVTLTGGEPLMQANFAARIFRYCKEIGIHTALDTSGFLGKRATDEMLDDTDLVLLDVKSGLPDTYRTVTTRSLTPTLEFGRRLAERGNLIWLRFVLVPGLTDAVENVDAVAGYVASLQLLGSRPVVERVEILPFHQMGKSKWHELGIEYPLEGTPPPSDELIDRVRAQFQARGLTVF